LYEEARRPGRQQAAEQPITDPERHAYSRLVAERPQRGGAITIVGPLARTESGQPPAMEVRQFTWHAAQTARR
jgi:hypothetical protein